MQAQAGVVVALAVLDEHVVADLPGDAVAVVVAGDHAAEGQPAAILGEDAARVVAVEVVVVGAVAVERQVLDRDVRDVLGREQGEEARGGGLALLEPEVLAEGLVELEAVARAGHERPLDDDGPAGVGILGPQADAVADLEPAGVGQGHLLVVPVGAGRELGRDRGLLDQDRFRPAAQEADARRQIDRVAETEGSRQHRAPCRPRGGPPDRRPPGGPSRSSPEVALARAHGDGEQLDPMPARSGRPRWLSGS